MKRAILFILFSIVSYSTFGQNSPANDIIIPEQSPFSVGEGSIQGAIANSVEEVTGKVVTAVPIANIDARTISYPVALSYNGHSVFKQAQYLNQHRAQSSVGIGWSLSTPKIVADHKGTATREDDTFYLVNGSSPNKLICTNRVVIEFPTTGNSYFEFQTEQYVPYKVRYKISNIDIVNSNYVTTVHDYWEVIDDKGVVYTYGNTSNTREDVIAWGNWIGDSKNVTGASRHTTGWNLSKIEDQWGNNLNFAYDKVEQGINTTGPLHTEATYVSQISSSTGGKIVFNYDDKTALEYYEPHREQVEPDAYQEQYEKKYLTTINTYDRSDQLVYTYELDYDYVLKALGDRKQYLKSVIQKDNNGSALPSQEFEYYTAGVFAGGLKTVSYPTEGSLTYNYEEKTTFDSTSPSIVVEEPVASGYNKNFGTYSGNDYALLVKIDGELTHNNSIVNFGFKVISDYWTGQKWNRSEFVFPDPIGIGEYLDIYTPDNLKFVAGKDFYAFLSFDRSTNLGNVFLFHKEKNGVDWKLTKYLNLPIDSGSENFPNENPVLMSGEGFVAVGENRGGELFTFILNGDGWNYELISQGAGQFYYGANNNFIIALDEKDPGNSGADMITSVTAHPDNYYIHYIDATKQWRTKSWSATVDNNFTYVLGTNEPSYLYPSNSMAGFMADNNPEYIMRWNDNYDLIAMDDELGSYTDTQPLIPVMNNVFNLVETYDLSNTLRRPVKSIGFDGSTWGFKDFSSINEAYVIGLSVNSVISGDGPIVSYQALYHQYDSNNHQWSSSSVGTVQTSLKASFARDFFVINNQAYKVDNLGGYSSLGQVSPFGIFGSFDGNGSSSIYTDYRDSSTSPTSFYRTFISLDKSDNSLNTTILPGNTYNQGWSPNWLGGARGAMSDNVFMVDWAFKRIIDGEINKVIKNNVVSSIEIDNNKGEVRKIQYTYNDSHTLPNDQSTFYGEVIVENKGLGSGNNGKVIKYFKKGDEDIREAGLPVKVVIKDKNDVVKNESETEWDTYIKHYIMGLESLGLSYHLRPKKQIERVKLNGLNVVSETQSIYNTEGLLVQTVRSNSEEESESTIIKYGYDTAASGVSTILENKNMLSFPYQTLSTIDGTSVSVEQSDWTNEGSKYYINKNQSGVDLSTLRVNSEITKVDTKGNIQESHNGLGSYKTVLYGYNDFYPVATITNAEFDDVVNELSVSYAQLQNLNSAALESELLSLYAQLPTAIININLYDDQGRIIKSFDAREESINFYYDSFGRLDYTTDSNDKVIRKIQYNFASN